MRFLRLVLVLPLLWLALGCGSKPEPPPPLDDEATQAAIAEEDARVKELESQQ
jgi:hypothetical protein